MDILDKINSDLVEAMKARDGVRTITLRGIKSAIKYREIEKGENIVEDDVIAVLSSMAKKHRDSIDQYGKAGRDDLVVNEKGELEIVLSYLPEQLDRAELEKLVDAVISELGAEGPSGIGAVMKTIMPKVKGRADGKMVKEIVSSRLS